MNKFVDFDVKTITAGDYSIEFDIDREQYDHFKKIYYQENNPISEMAQFKLYIQDELEKRITALSDQGVDGPESANQPVKIAQITFGFYNRQIITWLKERGNYIK